MGLDGKKFNNNIKESIVDEDKRDIKDHVDYGFPDEKI